MSPKKITLVLLIGVISYLIFFELKQENSISTDTQLLLSKTSTPTAETPASLEHQPQKQHTKKLITHNEQHKKITQCEDIDQAPDGEYLEKIDAEDNKLRQIIADTNTVESRFTMLTNNPNKPQYVVKELAKLSNLYPDNSLISYELLSQCTHLKSDCSTELINSAVQKDTSNGAAWLAAAIYHVTNQQTQAAEHAIIQASKTSQFNEHWGDYVSTISTAYTQAGSVNNQLLDVIISGYTAAIAIPNYNTLFKFCKQASIDNMKLIEACLASGQLITEQGSMLISQTIGYGLQLNTLEKLGETKQIQQLMRKKEQFSVLYEQSAIAMNLIWRNKSLREEWKTELMRNGEVSTAELAIDEAIRISNDPTIDECAIVN